MDARMAITVMAAYDGKVFRPDEPLALEPNTRVTLSIETEKTYSYSQTKVFFSKNRALTQCKARRIGRRE
jgi:hypothetical protein